MATLPSDPADLGILEAAAALAAGELSALELTEACLSRIEERNGGEPSFDGAPGAVNAFVRVYPDQARAEAAASDERRRREGHRAPLLCGVPLAPKDLYGVAGRPVTASSRVLAGHRAEADAAVVGALRAAGMVVVGHTHTHEFAAGGTTDQVGNPHDLRLSAGGSSGGSAAALAAGMVPAALGTDTCGSLRIPSACCGTSTIKASHGRVSIAGIVPLAPSLDHAGPMARSVSDVSALLAVMATVPEATPLAPPPEPLFDLPVVPRPGSRPLEGAVVATTSRVAAVGVEDEVAAGYEAARRALEALGARIVEVQAPAEVPDADLSAVLLTEVWDYHRRFADRAEAYRPAIAELVEAARNFVDAPAYLAAQRSRAAATRAWEALLADEGVDAVFEPTLPVLPPRRGHGYEAGHAGGAGDPLVAFSALWDLTGMPVVSLPVTPHVGVSLIGRRGAEVDLLRLGCDLQARELAPPGVVVP